MMPPVLTSHHGPVLTSHAVPLTTMCHIHVARDPTATHLHALTRREPL